MKGEGGSALPILLRVWRRPDLTRRVVQELVSLGLEDVFVFSDGPRLANPQDTQQVGNVRRIIEETTEIPSLKLRTSSHNLGLRGATLAAIDWFFSEREAGLVLEDDVLPSVQMIEYAARGLDRYRNDEAVSQINVSNHAIGISAPGQRSYLSVFHHVWGFATWKTAWQDFSDFAAENTTLSASDIALFLPGFGPAFYRAWAVRANQERLGSVDTFASSWNVFNFKRGTRALTPAYNLAQNVGFGPGAVNALRIPLIAGPPPQADLTKSSPEVELGSEASARKLDSYVASTQWSTQPKLLRALLAVLEWFRRYVRVRPWRQANFGSPRPHSAVDPYLTVGQLFYRWIFFRSR